MTKTQLQHNLTEKHSAFVAYLNSLSSEELMRKQSAEKWCAGQQMGHIYLSVKPVNLAFSLPNFLLRILFGKATTSRSYEELVSVYQNSLVNGGKAAKAYQPKEVAWKQKEQLIHQLETVLKSINSKIEKYSEGDLDQLRLPHPLIGKITLREMLYFTIYHVQHHHQKTIENLEQ